MAKNMLCCKSGKKGRVRLLIKKVSLFIFFLGIAAILIYNLQIIPTLIPLAQAQATTNTTVAVQNVIRNCVRTGEYSDFIQLHYSEDGTVTSLETNTSRIALLTGDIIAATANALCGTDRLSVYIPAGNLSGGALFSGRGPDIQIQLAVSPKITCDIQHEFFESGINQTLHRILACVHTEVYTLIPAAPKKTVVTTEYCIAETVIVGRVPDAYTKINRFSDEIEESEIDDLYDFGATVE